jgi:hypothetical protein
MDPSVNGDDDDANTPLVDTNRSLSSVFEETEYKKPDVRCT